MARDARTHRRRTGALLALAAAMLLSALTTPIARAAQPAGGTGCVIGEAAPMPPGPAGAPFVIEYVPTGVSLEWPPATPDSCPIASYRVYGTVNGTTSLLATPTAPFVRISGLASATYTIQVTAVDSAGTLSPQSPSLTAFITAIPPVSDPPCVVTYALNNAPGTFTLSVTLRNEAFISPPINGWTLTFPLGGDQRITNASNALMTQSGPQVTATNLTSNAMIPFFGAVTFDVHGTWTTSDAAPGPAVLIAPPYGRLIC